MMNMGNLISHAAQARLARGYVATTPPYGFTVDEDNKMIQEEAEHLICNAVKWGRYSGYSWKKMAELLNEQGYYNRAGRPWSLHNLRAIFIKREGFKKIKRDDRWLSIWERYMWLPPQSKLGTQTELHEAV